MISSPKKIEPPCSAEVESIWSFQNLVSRGLIQMIEFKYNLGICGQSNMYC